MNSYYRSIRGRNIISKKGRQYRSAVIEQVKAEWGSSPPRLAGRLDVRVTAYPPDRRKRDLDNLFKSLLDAMEHAELFVDDGQIDHLQITRGHPSKPGEVFVCIQEIIPETLPKVQRRQKEEDPKG